MSKTPAPLAKTPSATAEEPAPVVEFFYLYCVVGGSVSEKFGKIGIGGQGDEVYGIPYKDLSAIVSRTRRRSFERNNENLLAHERVIQEVFGRFPAVRLPFSTILESSGELEGFLAGWYNNFRGRLKKLQETAPPPISSVPSEPPIEQAPAAPPTPAAPPVTKGEGESAEVDKDIQQLREQLERMKKIQLEASRLSDD